MCVVLNLGSSINRLFERFGQVANSVFLIGLQWLCCRCHCHLCTVILATSLMGATLYVKYIYWHTSPRMHIEYFGHMPHFLHLSYIFVVCKYFAKIW